MSFNDLMNLGWKISVTILCIMNSRDLYKLSKRISFNTEIEYSNYKRFIDFMENFNVLNKKVDNIEKEVNKK